MVWEIARDGGLRNVLYMKNCKVDQERIYKQTQPNQDENSPKPKNATTPLQANPPKTYGDENEEHVAHHFIFHPSPAINLIAVDEIGS